MLQRGPSKETFATPAKFQPLRILMARSKTTFAHHLLMLNLTLNGGAQKPDAVSRCQNLGALVTGIVNTCLMDRPTIGDSRGRLLWVDRWAASFSDDPETVLELVDTMSGADTETTGDCLTLMARIFDDARMNQENEEPGASDFFHVFELGLSERTEAGELDDEICFGLCQAYLRAGLTPPDQMRIAPNAIESLLGDDVPELPNVADLAEGLVLNKASPFETYTGLRDVVGAMPAQVTTAFLTQMIGQGDPRMIAVGRYFLLDPVAEMRDAAIAGFELLVEGANVDATLLSDLIQIRNWLPNGKMLDRLIKTALRKEPSGGSVPQPWQLHRIMTSLPDGTGSQSIMGVCSRGSTRAVAAAMIKEGHGIKDAYVIPCSSRSDQKTIVEQIGQAMTMHDVSPSYLAPAIGFALGDGLAHGAVTTPGFLDVAAMFGIGDLTPNTGGHGALLGAVDPEGKLAALSETHRSRLIGKSRDWFSEHDISTSWFVSDDTLMVVLEEASTAASARKIVAAHLGEKRDRWAKCFARSALILRNDQNAPPDAWMSFAAVAQALEAGRDIKKIPVFEDILGLTLEVARARTIDDPGDDLEWGNGGFEPPDIEPERHGELARLLKGSPLKPDQIDGYLTAVLIAPEFVSPNEWLMPLLGGVEVKGHGSIQRILDILMLRYGALDEAVILGEIGAEVRNLPPKRFVAWVKGFSQAVDGIKGAWPKRALSRDDKRVLNLIRNAANDDLTQTLKPLLPSWLQMTAVKWRED
ncbi:MAG: YecA family protein [Loktanella sp.]|nr:YecA family protein [Loktanella sp.]